MGAREGARASVAVSGGSTVKMRPVLRACAHEKNKRCVGQDGPGSDMLAPAKAVS